MAGKIRFWGAFLLLTAICWIDYQFFTEGARVNYIPERTRQIMHLVLLLSIVPVGYLGWASHTMSWVKKLWLLAYLSAITLIVIVGAVQWAWAPFHTEQMDIISTIRLFFCSPMPFLILYIFTVVLSRSSALPEKKG